MVKIKYNFNKLQGALKETGAELTFKYKFYKKWKIWKLSF